MLTTVTVDIGTTSVKLCLFDTLGTLVASERADTPTIADAWGEIYDLGALERLVASFIQGLEPEQRRGVERIAITGVGESGGLVKPDLSLASPMILWHDHRGAGYLEHLTDHDRAEIYRITGLPVNANYGLSKVAWARDHAGGDATGAQWMNVAEFLAALMTGERWSEYSLASRTMALDLQSGTWSAAVCALLGLDVELFPELRTATSGTLISSVFALDTGLSDEVHVHVAGHDHMVGATGAALRRGELLNSTGTTEGLLFLREAPSLDATAAASRLANGIVCTGSDFTLFASIPTGGAAFATLRGMLDLSTDALTAAVARGHERYLAGDVDLERLPIVLPQFRGSPPPTKNSAARGVIAGLGTNTSADDIVLGVFLGMTLQFRDVLELFGTPARTVKVIGPASRNPLWLQLKADLLGVALSVSRFPEVVSRGAQALASDEQADWADSDPVAVTVDAGRHEQLTEWATAVRPKWDYLKGVPW